MNRDKNILGIHIDDDFLNIVHLIRTENGLKVHNAISRSLPEGTVKGGLINDTNTISRITRDFIKANRLKSCKAIMSLSCSAVRLKPSEFPALTERQLQIEVEDQVGKYSLFEGHEVVFDYCVFNESDQSSGKQTVLQAVTARRMSDACLKVGIEAGVEVVRIEPAILPIIKLAFNKQATGSEGISLLLALDSTSGSFSVFKDGIPQLCQNLNVGTKDLLQCKDSFIDLAEQTRSILEFARTLIDSELPVLKVSASCDSEKFQAIVKQIKQGSGGMTVEPIECSQIAKQFDIQGVDQMEGSFFALASSLMAFGVCQNEGELNLISKETLAVQKTYNELSLTAKVAAAIVLLSIAFLVPLKMKTKSVAAASSRIEAKVEQNLPTSNQITDLRKQMKRFNESMAEYAHIDKEVTDIPWPKILQAIGDILPDDVRIVSLSMAVPGGFTVLGEALSERNVYRFMRDLQSHKLIESAKVEEIEYDESSDQVLVDYKIVCKIRIVE